MWKKRTPRLAAPSSEFDDEDDSDNAMDTSTDFSVSNQVPKISLDGVQQKAVPMKRRARFEPLSEQEYRIIVDDLEALCNKDLWGIALKKVEELLARRCDEKVLEMKAQILMELRRDFEAAKCCESAIKLNSVWWELHRTHGRALLAFGEPQLALLAFQKAVRLNPADEELREELNWVRCNTQGSVPAGDEIDFTRLVKKR